MKHRKDANKTKDTGCQPFLLKIASMFCFVIVGYVLDSHVVMTLTTSSRDSNNNRVNHHFKYKMQKFETNLNGILSKNETELQSYNETQIEAYLNDIEIMRYFDFCFEYPQFNDICSLTDHTVSAFGIFGIIFCLIWTFTCGCYPTKSDGTSEYCCSKQHCQTFWFLISLIMYFYLLISLYITNPLIENLNEFDMCGDINDLISNNIAIDNDTNNSNININGTSYNTSHDHDDDIIYITQLNIQDCQITIDALSVICVILFGIVMMREIYLSMTHKDDPYTTIKYGYFIINLNCSYWCKTFKCNKKNENSNKNNNEKKNDNINDNRNDNEIKMTSQVRMSDNEHENENENENENEIQGETDNYGEGGEEENDNCVEGENENENEGDLAPPSYEDACAQS